jgi:tryptophan 2,3-dioxygenase
MVQPIDRPGVAESGAHTDFSRAMSYGDYLHLDELLGAQHCLSDRHDELLFVVIHQASELWMKLVIHELAAARDMIGRGDLQPAFKCTARVSKIQDLLIQSWGILSTLTPAEYLTFRDKLGQSSGFQSAQYRTIEFVLGNKSNTMLEVFRHQPVEFARLESELKRASLYDEAIKALHMRGFEIDESVLNRDFTQTYVANDSVAKAWLSVYQDPQKYWDLYELAEELLDLEDCFQQWRFRHMTTVKRVIGFKRGTGGTAGVPYLKRVLDVVLFPELWDVRTSL